MTQKPLHGIKVLDFTNVLAGPYCSMLLGNMGAEIIKVEKQGAGDDSRAFGPHVNGQSVYFMSINRGKKSIVCNTKTEAGRAMFKRLVEKVDLLVENLKPGALERMGLGYDTLKEINSKLVYVSVSGFGHSGPYSPRPAYDMIVQAMGGIISITGQPGGEPVRVGTSVGDIVAGMYGAFGAVNALYQRRKTGLGQKVDIAMFDCQLSILENAIAKYAATGNVPGPLGMRHASITPFQAFSTSDSRIIVACGNNALFRKLCGVLDIPALAEDARFNSNARRTENVDALAEILQEKFSLRATAEWLDTLISAGIPCGPINGVDKLFSDPQVAARNMLVEVDQPGMGAITVAGNPVKLSTVPPEEELPAGPAPAVGEHTQEILVDLLGYSEKEAREYLDAML